MRSTPTGRPKGNNMADATVAQLLTTSRAAHVQGRGHVKQRKFTEARKSFRVALERRQRARAADPGYSDPAWAADLTSLHSRKQLEEFLGQRLLKGKDAPDPPGYDQPSRVRIGAAGLLAEVARIDKELDAYYRQQLGEDVNTHAQVDLTAIADAVIPPDEWRTVTEGSTLCLICTHPKASHGPRCRESVFDAGAVQRCPCEAYVLMSCRHVWVLNTDQQRRCGGCGTVQQLFPKLAVEETEAYRQLQLEQQARQ